MTKGRTGLRGPADIVALGPWLAETAITGRWRGQFGVYAVELRETGVVAVEFPQDLPTNTKHTRLFATAEEFTEWAYDRAWYRVGALD